MKKLYLSIASVVLLSSVSLAQQKVTQDQINPILQKLDRLGKQNPMGAFPMAQLEKEEIKLFKAYQKQKHEEKINPYGITEQELKARIPQSQIQPILDKMQSLNSQEAFPANKFTYDELRLLRIYELQNIDPKTSNSKALTMAHVLNSRTAVGAPKPFGTLPLVPPYTLNVITDLPSATVIFADDVAGDGKVYGLENTARTLVRMDEGGVVSTVASITGIPAADTFVGLSYNAANGMMYAMASTNLYSLDMATGAATLIGSVAPTMTVPIWLEIDSAGNAFSLDISSTTNDNLYSINLTTGAATLVGATGVNFSFAQEADFNRDNNTLYMAGYRGGGAAGIYTVNTATGAATLVGDHTALNAEFTMYSITNSLTPPVVLNKAYADVIFDPAGGDLGIYSFPLDNPSSMTLEGANPASLFADDLAGDGNVYALNYDTNYLVKIYNGGVTRNVGPLTGLVSGETVTGLSWNRANNMMYATSTSGEAGHLYSVDLASGALTLIGETTGSLAPIWLEIDNNGLAYSADITSDNLSLIDLTTGAATAIGNLPYDIIYAQDADFNTSTNELYAALMYDSGDASSLGKIDVATGAVTIVGTTDGRELGAFTITDSLLDAPPIPPVTCGDNFTDSGGAAANYGNNEDITTVIQPINPGDRVTITFTEVDIETSTGTGTTGGCWDYLSIYNGDSISSPALAEVKCGEPDATPNVASSVLLVGDTFTSTDPTGKLTVRFRSDSSVGEPGWQATVSCASAAVDESNASNFAYYPNPTTGILNIKAAKNIERVEIYSIVGQKVMTVSPNAKTYEINLSSLKPGVYLVKSSVDGNVTTNKVIKK